MVQILQIFVSSMTKK